MYAKIRYKFFQKSHGFSMIELIIGISLLLMIGVIIWTFQKDIFSLNSTISDSVVVQDDVRRIFKTITSEIRSASPSSVGAYLIDSATPTSFTFYSDINDDGIKERIRYFLDGNTLKKGIVESSGNPIVYNLANEEISEIVHNISNINNNVAPIFSYYDTNYDGSTLPMADPVNILAIRLIKITVIIDQDTTKLPNAVTFTTQVSIRNLKDNL
jgi:hypothetical protein